MNLHQCFLNNNKCYKTGKKIKPKGVMVHSTGANNPTLRRYVQPDDGLLGKNPNGNHWNQDKPGGSSVCVHAFIGKLKDGSIATYQTLPWDMRGWHSGSGKKGSANNKYIGFEICEDGLTNSEYFRKVYKEAVELTAYLCKLYHLDPLENGVVICHNEGHQMGIASGHADVLHWFPTHGKSMDDFRADVAKEMKGDEVDMTKDEVKSLVQTTVDNALNKTAPKTFKTINDVPAYWRSEIASLVESGALHGNGAGELDLTETEAKMLAVMARLVNKNN